MELLILISLFFLNILVFIQDYKFRAVSWYLFALTFIVNVIYGFTLYDNFSMIIRNIVFNCGISLIIFIAIYFYALIRFKVISPRRFFNSYLGLGDLLYIITLTPVFSAEHFVFFLTLAFAASIFIYLVTLAFKRQEQTVPLAGNMSLCFISFIIITLIPFNFI